MTDPILRVRGLTKSFDGTVAVNQVSLELHPGEIVGLLGPNGAGKTTLIHLLLGILLPEEGSIEIFGKPFHKNRKLILERMNFSSAYTSLPFSLSCRQNLRIFGMLYRAPGLEEKIEQLLKDFEIYDLADAPVRNLSSGQLTRLNLAKALINSPSLLLLDEPTASLDPDMADKTRKILRRIQKESSITVLYSSHNMKEVESLCDRILFIQKGKLAASGTPKELLEKFQGSDMEQVFLKITRSDKN